METESLSVERARRSLTATPSDPPQPQNRCETCKKDRKRCNHTKGKPRCDRCEKMDYICSWDDDDFVDGKRRKLSKMKCSYCRSQKIKCAPENRVWDGSPDSRCDACKKSDKPCSEPQTANRTRETSKLPDQQAEDRPSSSPAVSRSDGRAGLDFNTSQPLAQMVTRDNVMSPRLDEPLNIAHRNFKFSDVPSQQLPLHNEYLPMSYSRSSNDPWGHIPKNGDTFTYGMGPDTGYDNLVTGARYLYSPLDGNNAIRLIRLFPGEANNDITISLEHFPDNPPAYQALSCTWGNDPRPHPIPVQDRNNISILKIQPNVHAALRGLRLRSNSIYLWIDAICIDQGDVEERSLQVMRMETIYRKATTLLIWLDPGNANVSNNNDPIEFMKELLDVSKFDSLMQDGSRTKEWQALEDLFQNKWFSRRWVVQEVALSRSAILHWGTNKIQWEDFADVVAILASRIKYFPNLQKHADFLSPSHSRRKLPATKFVGIYNSLFRKTWKGQIIAKKYSLETLVSILAAFEVPDRKDAIYGVLALAIIGHEVVPSYEKAFEAICQDFVQYCVEKSKSLDIICRHWVPIKPPEKVGFRKRGGEMLPSWCPSVLGSSFATYEDPNSNDRLFGDSFVGLPDRRYYNAALGTAAWAEFDRKDEAHGRVMRVKGLQIRSIAIIGDSASKGIIKGEWLQMAGWQPSDSDNEVSTSTEQLWRTIVADRDENGKAAPSWYRSAFLYCLPKGQDFDIDTQKLIDRSNTPSLVTEFLSRVQSVIWNRRLFTTAGQLGENEFGLAPRHAQVGDIICIVFGCSVPVLLRKDLSDRGDYYKLIGEVYLHDMMDGQALFGKTEQEVKDTSRIFMLR